MTSPDADRKRFSLQLILVFCLIFLGASPIFAKEAPTDTEISIAVQTRLMRDDGVNAHGVETEVRGGVVTLGGFVRNILAKERAVRLAESVKGVRSVIDVMTVQAPAADAAEIQRRIADAFERHPALETNQANVLVKDGVVTLTGTADSWQEKRLYGIAAKGVGGVKKLNNHLSVRAAGNRPDEEIRAEIVERLAWDVRVDSALIDVTVDRAAVSLSGLAGSAAEKRIARYDAWVAGVASVNADDLEVDWRLREDMQRDLAPASISDDKIRKAIRDALKYHPDIAALQADIQVDEGVVTLTGLADNLEMKNAAGEVARNTHGVWQVKNILRVHPGIGPVSRPMPDYDGEIARNARLAMAADPYVSQHQISVTVNQNILRLDGNVDSSFEKSRAEEILTPLEGVAFIKNNIRVGDNATDKEDWEIRHDIRGEFGWSPFLDGDDISVTVKDGVATLTGVVDTLRARRVATRNALEGGALRVRNYLSVRNGPEELLPAKPKPSEN